MNKNVKIRIIFLYFRIIKSLEFQLYLLYTIIFDYRMDPTTLSCLQRIGNKRIDSATEHVKFISNVKWSNLPPGWISSWLIFALVFFCIFSVSRRVWKRNKMCIVDVQQWNYSSMGRHSLYFSGNNHGSMDIGTSAMPTAATATNANFRGRNPLPLGLIIFQSFLIYLFFIKSFFTDIVLVRSPNVKSVYQWIELDVADVNVQKYTALVPHHSIAF